MINLARVIFAALVLSCVPTLAPAQNFPTKPVRILVPFSAGGNLDPVAAEFLRKAGSVAVGSTPQAFDAFMRAEADKWGPVIKAANIKID